MTKMDKLIDADASFLLHERRANEKRNTSIHPQNGKFLCCSSFIGNHINISRMCNYINTFIRCSVWWPMSCAEITANSGTSSHLRRNLFRRGGEKAAPACRKCCMDDGTRWVMEKTMPSKRVRRSDDALRYRANVVFLIGLWGEQTVRLMSP